MNSKLDKLIQELQTKPQRFSRLGMSTDMLDHFHDGESLDCFHELLVSKDEIILRESVWMLSELASRASQFMSHLIRLYLDETFDPTVRYYALETIGICAISNNSDELQLIFKAMNNESQQLRVLSMNLIANCLVSDLSNMLENRALDPDVLQGIEYLLDLERDQSLQIENRNFKSVENRQIFKLIGAARHFKEGEQVLRRFALNGEGHLKKFADNFLYVNQI